jgi:cytochrome bd-type quinol oxidase subunit 1
MDTGLTWHRIQFAFTVTFRYLFPPLTMGKGIVTRLSFGAESSR